MNPENGEMPRTEMADKFIELANELTATNKVERVSSALLFAAARYNAFEIAGKSQDLVKDRRDALTWFRSEYERMLEANIDEFMEHHQ